jgi:hypothetical protein
MRLLTIVALSCTTVAAACARAETASAAGAPAANLASPASPAEASAAAGAAEAAKGASSVREITIPVGTVLPVTLDTSVGSDTSRVEQAVNAHVSQPIVINGRTVVPAGSRVSGVVTDAKRSGKVKGVAHIGLRFESLTPSNGDERYRIHTSAIGRSAPTTKKKDALEIGAPAAGGAIVGAIVGGKKGALVGTAVGGGAGTAVVLSTRGKEIHLPRGTALRLRLTEPVTIRTAA